jgi:hypothetical protein
MLSSVQNSLIMDGALVEVKKVGHNGPIQVGHGLGRIPKGVLVVSADVGCYRANILHATRSTLKLSLTPEWELIDHVEIVDTVDVFDFDTVYGDRDCEYKIDGYWKCSGNVLTNLTLRVNGSTAGLNNRGGAFDGTAATGTSTQMLVVRKINNSTSEEMYFEHTMYAKTGENRTGRSLASATYNPVAASTVVQTASWKAEDTTTKITSIGLDSTAGTYIGAGSTFSLYRRPPAKGRNINLWIF